MSKTTKTKAGEIPSTTAIAKFQPQAQALGIFAQAPQTERRLKRIGGAPIVRSEQMPPGVSVEGEVYKVSASPIKKYTGNILWMRHPNGQEFGMPCKAVIHSALADHFKEDREQFDDNKAVGLYLVIVAQGKADSVNAKGKTVARFDVYIAEKPGK